ncbi:hypothetical protein SAMN05192568_101940 [Methylobacterium pseudosasicola]|uniref:Uncharacterized protein n=1 Tax=Methylobacterium pseudosasicola TaxID=582667 RepID=A0A1I4N262_9HYPH|nr:hypothetical protein SAMN05192568_101940 [Methylobacterium pseudosasicola]
MKPQNLMYIVDEIEAAPGEVASDRRLSRLPSLIPNSQS